MRTLDVDEALITALKVKKTLRDKCAIMTNMWLLAQMKQPARSISRDFDRSTFSDFLERLLDKKNFNLHKEVSGTLLLVSKWTDCMSYEFELRKDANRLCREEGSGIKSALWTTIENTEHRMIHWLQLVSIARGDCAELERKVNELQREVQKRSRSPRRKGGNRKLQALPAGMENQHNFQRENGIPQPTNKMKQRFKGTGHPVF